MKIVSIYRLIIFLAVIGNIVWFVFPWGLTYADQLDHDFAMTFQGSGAIFDKEITALVGLLLFVFYLATYAGLFFFARWSRQCFLLAIILSGLWMGFSGIHVGTSIQVMSGSMVYVLEMIVFAMSFQSGINEKFIRKSGQSRSDEGQLVR